MIQNHPSFTSETRSLRLVVVEDNVLLRRMLKDIAEGIPGLEWGMGCGSLKAARRELQTDACPPYGIVVDICLPDGKGWELLDLPALRSGGSQVFLATGKVDQYSVSLLSRRRIAGFIDKCSADLQDWKDAFECLSQRRSYTSPSIAAAVMDMISVPNHWSKLFTSREFELIHMLCEGDSNIQIAERTGNSPATIQVHRRNVMRKLNLNTATELVRWGTKAGFSRWN